jgi:acyl dehydratase
MAVAELAGLPVGAVAAEERYRVTPEAVVRYAGASGDFTAVHYDYDVARQAGYTRMFAMGMLSAGHLGALLVRLAGEAAVLELTVRFRERSWLGEDVTCRAVVAERDPVAGTVRLDLAALAPDGRALSTGSALLRI